MMLHQIFEIVDKIEKEPSYIKRKQMVKEARTLLQQMEDKVQ